MHYASIVCWHCGKGTPVAMSRPPQFGFELAAAAEYVGMMTFNDFRRHRTLFFCSADHALAQKTKTGHFRVRQNQSAVASDGVAFGAARIVG